MGNACYHPKSSTSTIKVIAYGGSTRILTGVHLAGEIMFQFPDQMLCHADSFYIGHPIPSLAIEDELIGGQTYFLLPLDSFANNILSVSSISGLSSGRSKMRGPGLLCSKDSAPFEYVKGCNGRVLIKVSPEFITRLISNGDSEKMKETVILDSECGGKTILCSTPELQKQYNQLVGYKEQVWSPKLDTITEYKIRFSPCKFLGLEWREKEV